MTVQVGVAVRDITPPLGLPLGGYEPRDGVAMGVLDRLYCRAAVIAGESGAVALVALDLAYVSGKWSQAVRESAARALGCAPANVLVAATHTHAGPNVFCGGEAYAADMRAYELYVAQLVGRAVADACACLQPAMLAIGQADVAGVAADRHAATAAAVEPVKVIRATSPEGRCLAVIAGFACHPTVLPPANLSYSRDLFGAAVDIAELSLGAPVVLFNGAAADVSTRFTRREQTGDEAWRLGRILGEGIVRAASEAGPCRSRALGGGMEQVPVRFRTEPPLEEAQRRAAQALARLEQATAEGRSGGDLRRLRARMEGASLQLLLAAGGGWKRVFGCRSETAPVQVLRIGDCELLGAPGEAFSSVGRGLCAARSGPAMVIGYANDYLGYLVPSSMADSGEYESMVAMVEPASADAIAARLAAMAA